MKGGNKREDNSNGSKASHLKDGMEAKFGDSETQVEEMNNKQEGLIDKAAYSLESLAGCFFCHFNFGEKSCCWYFLLFLKKDLIYMRKRA